MTVPRVLASSNIVHEAGSDDVAVDLQLTASLQSGSIIRLAIPKRILQGLLDTY